MSFEVHYYRGYTIDRLNTGFYLLEGERSKVMSDDFDFIKDTIDLWKTFDDPEDDEVGEGEVD